MDVGLLIHYGAVVAGREEQAMVLYQDTTSFFGSLLKDGKITSFESFMYSTADFEEEQGFFIVKGPVAEIFAILDGDAYKTLVTRGNLLLHHVRIHLLTVGEGISAQLERFARASSALHA